MDFDAWRRQSAQHQQAHELAAHVSSALDDFLTTDPALRAMAEEAFAESGAAESSGAESSVAAKRHAESSFARSSAAATRGAESNDAPLSAAAPKGAESSDALLSAATTKGVESSDALLSAATTGGVESSHARSSAATTAGAESSDALLSAATTNGIEPSPSILHAAAPRDAQSRMAESALVEPQRTKPAEPPLAAQAARRQRWIVPASLAASLFAIAIGARFIVDLIQRAPVSVNQFVTDGSRRDVQLADGSIVHLDIASEVDTRLSGQRREIELVRGRALFEVAHDTSRPFTVSTGSVQVTALGTRFQVQREEDRTVVTLTQGSIVVSNTVGATTWREVLTPGEQVVLAPGERASPQKRLVDPRTATSWTSGRHVFKATPLAEAIEEVNRYSGTKLRLGDPDLAGLVVGGSFNAGDSASVVAAFAAALPLRVVDTGSEVILFRHYRPESD